MRMGGNFRAGAFRIARVQNPDRNVLTPCRQQGGGMKNLRAEVSQLGGFIKTHSSDASRLRTWIWIGRHHTINVRPNLDPGCVQSGAHDSGAEIRTPAAKGSWKSIAR